MSRDYTTSADDNVLDKCEEFGGLAADCARIAEILDDKINQRDDTIAKLENQIGELEYKIEELERQLKEARQE